MASNPFFSGRISQELYDHIEKWREETKESKTDVLARALAKYTDFELNTDKPTVPPINEKLDEIFRRLDALENKKIMLDNRPESKIKQLKITPNSDVITKDKSNTDNIEITSDNKVQILSAKDTVALVGEGCSVTSLSRWKRQNKLPKIVNEYQIENEGKGKWKVSKIDIDNSDNQII